MKSIILALFLLTALPITAFAQNQYCYKTQAEAEAIRDYFINDCKKDGGIPNGNIFLGTGENFNHYCAGVNCNICKMQYKKEITPFCCQLKRVPKPLNSFGSSNIIGHIYGIAYSEIINLPEDMSEWCTNQPDPVCDANENDDDDNDSSNSGSNGESSSSSDNASSSSSGNSGSSSSGGEDEPDDDYDFDHCFSSYGEAMASNLLRRAECTGDNISDLEIVPHPNDDLWCLIGSCNIPSSSSSSDGGGISSGSSTGSWCTRHPESVCCPDGGFRNCECGHGTSLAYRPADADGICDYGTQVWRCGADPAYIISEGKSPCNEQLLSSSNNNTSSSSCLGQSSSSSAQSNSSSSAISSSSMANSSSSSSSSSSINSPSSSSSNGISSSAVDIYDFCHENPNNFICLGILNSSGSNSSSSQGTSNKPNDRSPDAVYTVDDIFSSGLDNMEPGKCYGLNPDRGTQYGWINSDAQDSWWWEERPCDGSKPIEPVTTNGCRNNKRGANAVYTTSDCFSSGLDNMEPGKCYSLNPDRDTQYGWINIDAQNSWWWREVPCGMIFLQKKYISENGSDSMRGTKTELLYDAAGRKTTAKPKIRRFLFPPKKTP